MLQFDDHFVVPPDCLRLPVGGELACRLSLCGLFDRFRGGHQFVEAPQVGDDLLADSFAFPVRPHNKDFTEREDG